MTGVTIENLRKEYGSIVATNDVSLDIADGELAVLVGPSGCGKTTTLRSIAGLETPTDGTIAFGDADVTNDPPQDRDISMVFQNLALYPHMTTFDNIAFPLQAENNASEAEIREAVESIARDLDCEDFLDQRVVELSGGQQQRVALARALVREPEVFLMDEPFSDLDELLKRKLRSEVVRLQHEREITMVHVTHDQEEAITMGDRLVVMNGGDVVQMGDPDTVFNEPAELFVAQFIGSPQINRFDCTLERTSGETTLRNGDLDFSLSDDLAASLDGAGGEEIALCVRPQHVSWAERAPENESDGNGSDGDGSNGELSVPVTVEVIEKIGTEDVVRCRGPNGSEVLAVVASGTLDEGAEGYLRAEGANAHLFDGYDEHAERLN
jgi:multiple sugar transport system ATP-binding protein